MRSQFKCQARIKATLEGDGSNTTSQKLDHALHHHLCSCAHLRCYCLCRCRYLRIELRLPSNQLPANSAAIMRAGLVPIDWLLSCTNLCRDESVLSRAFIQFYGLISHASLLTYLTVSRRVHEIRMWGEVWKSEQAGRSLVNLLR